MMVGRKAESPPPPLSRSQICPSVQLRYYFTCPAEGVAYTSGSDCVIEAGLPDGTTTVLGLGSPLFDASFLERANVVGGDDRDNTKVDAATVYVTLSSNETGIWNPFSWYPYVPTTKWAAIVTERSTVDDVAVLFDRGYGWVYLTSETGFETKSTTPCCLDRYKAESYRSTGEFLELRSRWYRCRLE